MDFTRRAVLAAAAARLVSAPEAKAEDRVFPREDINFIIPYAPGGGFDSYVRIVLPYMAAALPNRVNILPLNETGAAGAKAAIQLLHDRPNGYNIGILNVPGLLVLQVLGGVPFDLSKLSWIGNMGRDPYGLAVAYDSPIKSLDDLRALSRKRPVKFTCTGRGSTGYAATMISTHLLGIPMQLIAGYEGTTEYLLGTVRGDGDAAICSLTAMRGLEAAKQIRIIASFEQHTTIPGVPDATTLKQPDLARIMQLRPIAGPPHMPAPIVATLSSALVTGLGNPAVRAWAAHADANLDAMTAEQAQQAVAGQIDFIESWKKALSAPS